MVPRQLCLHVLKDTHFCSGGALHTRRLTLSPLDQPFYVVGPRRGLPSSFQQLSYIRRDRPGLVLGEQIVCRSPAGLIVVIDIRKHLAGFVPDDQGGCQVFD